MVTVQFTLLIAFGIIMTVVAIIGANYLMWKCRDDQDEQWGALSIVLQLVAIAAIVVITHSLTQAAAGV